LQLVSPQRHDTARVTPRLSPRGWVLQDQQALDKRSRIDLAHASRTNPLAKSGNQFEHRAPIRTGYDKLARRGRSVHVANERQLELWPRKSSEQTNTLAWPEICTPCASGSSRPPSQCSNSTLGTDAIRSCAEPSRHKAWMFLLTGFLRHPGCATAPAPRGQPENATTCRRPPRPLGPGVLRRAVDTVTTAFTFDLDHFRARVLQDCLTCFKR